MLDDRFQDVSGERPSLAVTAVVTVLACAGSLCWQWGGEGLPFCNHCNTDTCSFYSGLAVKDKI